MIRSAVRKRAIEDESSEAGRVSGPGAGQGRAGRACRDAGKEGDGTLLYERDDGQGAGCSQRGALLECFTRGNNAAGGHRRPLNH